MGKPLLHIIEGQDETISAAQLLEFIERYGIKILNIAGPRGSIEPKVGNFVKNILTATFLEGRKKQG